MGTTAEKLTYLNTTKAQIKDGINRLGGELTNLNTFREYKEALDDIYDRLPKVTGTGSDLSLTPTLKGGLNILPIGNCEQDTLPSEYQAVEYIESSGTQYIDTGFNGGNNYKIDCKIQDSVVSVFPFSDLKDSTDRENIGLYTYSSSKYGFFSLGTGYSTNTSINNAVEMTINLSNTGLTYTTNNDSLSILFTPVTNNGNVILFRRGTLNSYYSSTKLYKFKIYNSSDILVRNFIPCYRISDTEIGLYDLVNGVFYTNQGTGTFAKGNDVSLPNPDIPISIKVVTGDNQVVIQNKNLCDIILNGTIGNTVLFKTYTLKPNTNYTVSSNTFWTEGNIANVFAVSGTSLSPSTPNNGVNVSRTVTSDSNGKITLGYRNQEKVLDYSSGDYYIQIEEGSTATSYIAHQKQSTTLHLGSLELCKIGDYQDVITGSKDNWKVVRPIYKKVFNGTENWNSWFNVNECIGFYCSDNTLVRPSNENTYNHLVLSDKFSEAETRVEIVNGLAEKIKQCGGTGNQYIAIGLNKSRLSDYSTSADAIASFKTWLESNNVTVYEVKATPTETPITDTTLINELNGLQELLSYDGTTNITITSDSNNAQMLAEVRCLKGE